GGVPTGVSLPYFGDTAPDGFLMQSGPNYAGRVSQVDFGGLFSIVEFRGGPDLGDGTFQIPYLGDRFLVGQGSWGGVGTAGGVAAVTLGVGELPSHGHGVSDPGHPHGAGTTIVGSGAHYHEPGSARDSEFVTVLDPLLGGDFRPVLIDGTGAPSTYVSIPTNSSPTNPQQQNRSFTSTDGLHLHAATTVVSGASTGVSILAEGGGGAHENRPPYMVTNFIMKT
ncbi:MAG: hypothetical protein H7247_05725, partial [Polaromonas sp.]|nr:hypothetical protein [Gemmatimonadaceae bacterium]